MTSAAERTAGGDRQFMTRRLMGLWQLGCLASQTGRVTKLSDGGSARQTQSDQCREKTTNHLESSIAKRLCARVKRS